jgi:hypothetical protein
MELAQVVILPLLAIWLYEVSNMIVLMVQGVGVSLTTAGWVPVGVAGVSQATLSPLTKVAQVLLSAGLLSPLYVLFARARFLVAKSFLLATIAIFVASTYWELLSQIPYVPMTLHVGVFVMGTIAVSFLFLGGLMVPRSLKSRLTLSKQSS